MTGGNRSEFLLGLLEKMIEIREFEDGVKFLFLEGAMPGTIHQCQGQEATAVGVCSALAADDFITSTFRGHGHALAKGLSMQEMLDELFGAKSGCCAGKGGSMHMGNMDKGMVPGIAIVGGGIPLAAGMALSFKLENKPQIVTCFFGTARWPRARSTKASIWRPYGICRSSLFAKTISMARRHASIW